ncbi:glutamate-5-semialdehyde dehydrogenase [Micromonospora deserti]|uniref:glutamate-5-semialdehyde dehydrogenase n=1 Tax=Micromonospora deserti TaxID=2070366 RepID=UPI001F2035BA|nr:glutamate-5-semialdehyde dehydrogenase [Micromonospora deserti]
MTDVDDILTGVTTARAALPPPGDARYDRYCAVLAAHLTHSWEDVLAANAVDVGRAVAAGLGADLVDRLALHKRHLATLVGLIDRTRAALPAVTAPGPAHRADNGTTRRRLPKPFGVALMIYEARPTVTVEGALLPVAVGNAAVLRGGAEIAATNQALVAVVDRALADAELPDGTVAIVTDPDRRVVRALLKRPDAIDVLIPRGSPSLIDYCRTSSTIPVIASGGGVNHLYVDRSADLDLAARIALDSKLGEPTACNTLELVLAHTEVARELTRTLLRTGAGLAEPWLLRVDPRLVAASTSVARPAAPSGPDAAPAARPTTTPVVELTAADDGREFLERSIGIRPVAGLDEAVDHIRRFGSGHTEGVVATDRAVVDAFLARVDAAALVVNGSLRLHDGPTMGLGPELSISTGRLHVRGPVDLSALLTYSWVIEADGTLRGEGAAS